MLPRLGVHASHSASGATQETRVNAQFRAGRARRNARTYLHLRNTDTSPQTRSNAELKRRPIDTERCPHRPPTRAGTLRDAGEKVERRLSARSGRGVEDPREAAGR